MTLSRRRLTTALVVLATAPVLLGAAPPQPGPRAVLQRYFKLINQRKFHAAFLIWERDEQGRNAARQTQAQFAAGFARTRSVRAQIGPGSEPEGAAGSQYVQLDVTLFATLKSGRKQVFEGSYTMRKSNVEGGHPDWRIYQATMSETDRD